MSKFLKFIVNIFLICAILIAAAILIPPLAGIQTTIVDTASMDTNLPLGSITYSTDVDASEIQTGDEVLKDSNTSTYAYIVKSINRDTDTFTVVNAMDQNADTEEITLRNSVPKVAVVVPYIGYVIIAMHSTEGIIIIALVVVLIIILFILSELWKEKPEDEDEDEEEQKTYSFLDQEESGTAGEQGVSGETDSGEQSDGGTPQDTAETDGTGFPEDTADRNADTGTAPADASEEEQAADVYDETYTSSDVSEEGIPETGTESGNAGREDFTPAFEKENSGPEDGGTDAYNDSAEIVTGGADGKADAVHNSAESEEEKAQTVSAKEAKKDDGPDIPEYITNWSSGKRREEKKQEETSDAAPAGTGSAEEPQTVTAAETDHNENAESVQAAGEEAAEPASGDTRTFPTIRRNGSGYAEETENREAAYDLSDAIEQATQEAEKQAEEDAAKVEAQQAAGNKAAESSGTAADSDAEPEPQEKPEKEEEQEQFVPVEHATLDELLEQAKKAGDEPDVSKDDATGITVVDYSGVL